MHPHLWRILGGAARSLMFVLPTYIIWYVISYFDEFWNKIFWQRMFHRDIPFAGFIATFIIFYLVGAFSETLLGAWLDRNVFTKIPIIGRLFITLNPQVRDLISNSLGAVIAPFMSGWRPAFLLAIHKTKDGYLGSVGYIGIPPIPQQLDEKSRIKVREVITSVGGIERTSYELLPAEIAAKQELSFGTAVPSDAYKDLVEISFAELVASLQIGTSPPA